jgi:toxin ParE1/3/4
VAEFRLTPAAERDLEKIWVHTEKQWSADQADQYIERLTATFAELALHPCAPQPAMTSGQDIATAVWSGA